MIQDQEYIKSIGEIEAKEYVKSIGEIEAKDLGIDAVYINSDSGSEKEIILFNFKYRAEFNPDKTTSENDVSTSTKFLLYFNSESTLPRNIDKNSKVYKNIKEIRKCLRSDDIYKITLYMVTNEANGFSKDADERVKDIASLYDIEIKAISLDDIISFVDMRKDKISAKIVFSPSNLIDYKTDEKSTSISYICKVSLLDLIRITCNNKEVRQIYNWSNIDEQQLLSCKIEQSTLYDNVRGYLENTNYNKNIYRTIYIEQLAVIQKNFSCSIMALQLQVEVLIVRNKN